MSGAVATEDRARAPIADPARRIYARAIETVVPMALGVSLSVAGVLAGAPSLVRAGAVAAVLASLAVVVINAVLLTTRGQTLGKIPLGLVVTRLDGSLPGFGRAFVLRELLPMAIGAIPILGLLFGIVDGALMILTDRRRSLHDELADTLVLDVRPAARSEPV